MKFNRRNGRTQPTAPMCSWKRLVPSRRLLQWHGIHGDSKPPLMVLSLEGHESGVATYLSAIEPATKFVTDWFGKPTAPIAIADFADPHAAPFESGTLLMVSMAGEDTKLAGINLVHELVHSAFTSPRPWVSEGLAHFAERVSRTAGWTEGSARLTRIAPGCVS